MYPEKPCPPSHVLSYIPAEASIQYIHNIIRISIPSYKNIQWGHQCIATKETLISFISIHYFNLLIIDHIEAIGSSKAEA